MILKQLEYLSSKERQKSRNLNLSQHNQSYNILVCPKKENSHFKTIKNDRNFPEK